MIKHLSTTLKYNNEYIYPESKDLNTFQKKVLDFIKLHNISSDNWKNPIVKLKIGKHTKFCKIDYNGRLISD